MAKYGISPEGVSSLKQLASDMTALINDIQNCGTKLTTTVQGLGDRLGLYEDEIMDLVNSVNQTKEDGCESVTVLVGKVNKLASDITAIIGTQI